MKHCRLFPLILLSAALALGACTSVLASSTPTQSGMPTTAVPLQLDPSATATPLPTIPPTATPTIAPTMTATLSLPVGNGAPLPDLSLPVLSSENLGGLQEIARYGSPVRLGLKLTANRQIAILADVAGFRLFNVLDRKQVGSVQMDLPVEGQVQFDSVTIFSGWKFPASISADGQYILKEGTGSSVELWKVGEGLLYSLPLAKLEHASAALSPDGNKIAVSECESWMENSCTLKVIDWQANQTLFEGGGNFPLFSPDGNSLAVNFDRSISIIHTESWQTITQIAQPQREISEWRKAFSADGELMALVEYNAINVWRLADRKLVRTITAFDAGPHAHYPPEVLFSPDANHLAIQPYFHNVKIVVVSLDDGSLAVAESEPDRGGFVWLKNGGSLQGFRPEEKDIFPRYYLSLKLYFKDRIRLEDAYYGPDGSKAGMVECIQANCKRVPYGKGVIDLMVDAQGEAYSIQKLEDGQTVLLKGRQTLAPLPGAIYSTLYGTQNNLVLVGKSGDNGSGTKTSLIDTTSGEVVTSWSSWITNPVFGHSWVSFFAYPPGQRIYSADIRLVLYDTLNRKVLFDKPGFDGLAAPLEESNSIFFITVDFTTYEWSITLINSSTGEEADVQRGTLKEADRATSGLFFSSIAVSPDGTLVAVGLGGGDILVFDAEAQRVVAQWSAHQGEVKALAFSADGTRLASLSDDGFLKVWADVNSE